MFKTQAIYGIEPKYYIFAISFSVVVGKLYKEKNKIE